MEPSTSNKSEVLDESEVNAVSLEDLRAAYNSLRERHHDRIVSALAKRKAARKKTGGDVPYGYRLKPDGETLVKDAAEQKVIAEVIRLRKDGLSFRKIARALWKDNIRSRPVPDRKGRLKTKRDGEFDPTQIRRMIEAHKQSNK